MYLVSFVLCYIEAISNVSRVGPRDKFITSKSENRGYSMKVRHFLFLLRINKKSLSLTCFTKEGLFLCVTLACRHSVCSCMYALFLCQGYVISSLHYLFTSYTVTFSGQEYCTFLRILSAFSNIEWMKWDWPETREHPD